jgi:hypothetical protein
MQKTLDSSEKIFPDPVQTLDQALSLSIFKRKNLIKEII